MNNDLISRQAAIDEIFNEPLYESGMKRRYADVVVPAIYEKIKSLPSAQPEQQWIPVTEESVIQAGYEGREVRFRVDGRLFAIRELAQ